MPSSDPSSLYLYHFAPMELAGGGLQGWDAIRQEYGNCVWNAFKTFTSNIDDSCILGRCTATPLDHHGQTCSSTRAAQQCVARFYRSDPP